MISPHDDFHCASRTTDPSALAIRPIPSCDWIAENDGHIPHPLCTDCIYNTEHLVFQSLT